MTTRIVDPFDVPAPPAEVRIPVQAVRGRGAATAMPHRFERVAREVVDDGWDHAPHLPPAPATRVHLETARSALNTNDSPDIFFEQSVNPYRGCEHGCIYCYARPTHSYLNFSPGLDFETQIIAKHNIAQLLDDELSRPRYVPRLLNIGSATDCYQPVERDLQLTRGVIEVLRERRHPFSLITKSSGVERDLDLLAPLAEQRLAAVYVTITTLDPVLARHLEPRAAAPHRRLRTIRTLAEAGVPVGVSVAPQIPFLTEDMEQVLEAAREAGARSAFYTVLRLPWELDGLFREWLGVHYPQRAARVMARVQDLHNVGGAAHSGPNHGQGGGQRHGPSGAVKVYDSSYATRMKGSGLWADLLRQRFVGTCRRLGLNRDRVELDTSQFRGGRVQGQGRLF